jgi:hypothetical protein
MGVDRVLAKITGRSQLAAQQCRQPVQVRAFGSAAVVTGHATAMWPNVALTPVNIGLCGESCASV